MKHPATYFAHALVLFGSLCISSKALAQVTYQPLAVTGYNEDVIADGNRVGTANGVIASTTNTVDRGNGAVKWCFADSSFVNSAGRRPTRALPASGIIHSRTTQGLTYQLGPSAGRNSLRIDVLNGITTGTLTILSPVACRNIKILATTGNGNTYSDNIFTLTFTDGTTQVTPLTLVPDWYGGTVTPAIYVGSRVNRGTTPADGIEDNSITNPNNPDPTIYEVDVTITAANFGKLVRSIRVDKTLAPGETQAQLADPVLNIMGVSAVLTCLSAPNPGVTLASAPNICPGSSSVLSLTGSTVGSTIAYQWQASTDGGVTFTNIVGATTTANLTVSPAVTTQYRVNVACGVLTSLTNVTTVTVLPNVATVTYASATNPNATFCQQQGTAPVIAATPLGGRFTTTAGLVVNPTTGELNLAASTTGTYNVTYTLTSPCPTTATATVTVIRTDASLAYGASTFCRTGTSGAPAFTPAGGTFSSPTGLAINTTTGVIDLATSTAGTYNVTYTSGGLCPASATATLLVKSDALPTFPNVIAPNSDNPRNKSLHLELSDVTGYHMEVFNRWGRRVWESSNAAEGWTAESKTGGTYYYQVEYTDCAGHHQLYKGWVDVIK
jgi:putative hemolysin